MLDRTDRVDSRRRGTDLVRVQQTRAIPKRGSGKKQTSVFLNELGPRRVVMQLKWFVSTIIVAISGLAIIGVVIYSSMQGEDPASFFKPKPRPMVDPGKHRASLSASVSIGRKPWWSKEFDMPPGPNDPQINSS